jgi:hypothetical protein
MTRLPPSFGDRLGQVPEAATPDGSTADAYTMKLDSAFWVWNLVGNFVQSKFSHDANQLIVKEIAKYESYFLQQTASVDKVFTDLYKNGQVQEALEYVTAFGVKAGQEMTAKWLEFWMFLFSRYRDGGIVSAPPLPLCTQGRTQGCTARPVPQVMISSHHSYQ